MFPVSFLFYISPFLSFFPAPLSLIAPAYFLLFRLWLSVSLSFPLLHPACLSVSSSHVGLPYLPALPLPLPLPYPTPQVPAIPPTFSGFFVSSWLFKILLVSSISHFPHAYIYFCFMYCFSLFYVLYLCLVSFFLSLSLSNYLFHFFFSLSLLDE